MITLKKQPASVLQLLCAANSEIDRIAGNKQPLPIVQKNGITHHVHALAGILRRTTARSISMQVGGIIVEARRAKC
jgi:hypothetical protein